MRLIDLAAALAALSLAGCSGEEGAPDKTAPAQKPKAAASGAAGPVTPEYLAGEWCYLRYEAGGEESQENITYIFAADGTLTYQTNSSTAVDQPGSYTVRDGILKIMPALASFDFVPVSATKEGMMLEAMGARSFWKRGACTAPEQQGKEP